MLGTRWASSEESLRAGKMEPELYAGDLLADILTRGQVLRMLHRRCLEQESGSLDEREALENLALGVEVFSQDLEEAAERAKRAGFLAGASYGALDAATEGEALFRMSPEREAAK